MKTNVSPRYSNRSPVGGRLSWSWTWTIDPRMRQAQNPTPTFSLTNTQMTRSRRSSRSLEMTSSRLKTCGLKSNQTKLVVKRKATTARFPQVPSLQIFSKKFTARQSSSSTNIKWWCNKSNKMSCNNRSQAAYPVWVSVRAALTAKIRY